ncbi:hypothetical protein GCM10020254_67140 [Streptomyces goshikiensis]
MAFFAKIAWTPGGHFEGDRVVTDLLHRGVHAADGADPGAGRHVVAHLRGRLLLLLRGAGHQEHRPDEHDEREECHEIHGTEILRTTARETAFFSTGVGTPTRRVGIGGV